MRPRVQGVVWRSQFTESVALSASMAYHILNADSPGRGEPAKPVAAAGDGTSSTSNNGRDPR